jgi:hypothetical protein
MHLYEEQKLAGNLLYGQLCNLLKIYDQLLGLLTCLPFLTLFFNLGSAMGGHSHSSDAFPHPEQMDELSGLSQISHFGIMISRSLHSTSSDVVFTPF